VRKIGIGTVQEAQQVVQSQGFTFPVLPISDWSHKTMTDYQVGGVPVFFAINEQGVIINADFAQTQEQIRTLVEMIEEHRKE